MLVLMWGPLFVGAPVRPHRPHMPKSASDRDYATSLTSALLSVCLSMSVILVDCDHILQQKMEIDT